MSSRLYIANLPESITDDSLQAAFAPYGTVSHVFVAMDRDTALPKGYAFVTYDSSEGAQAALAAMNGADFEGRTLAVSPARVPEVPPVRVAVRRPPPPGRSFGGPGGRPVSPGGQFRR